MGGVPAAMVAFLAVVSTLGWFAVVGALLLASKPPRPKPGPATMDPPGREPPAVVDLITNGWRVEREAVPATLLDLAARRVVTIELLGPEHHVVQVRNRDPGDLTAYEHRVLNHVRSLARNGLVPAEALTTGPQDSSKRWWRAFRKEVMEDARNRGLSRPRWPAAYNLILGATAVVPSIFLTWGFALIPSESSSDDDAFGLLFMPLVVWMALMSIRLILPTERETPAGLEAASRWLGLRRMLADNDNFGNAGPSAVAIWGRLLAYGAALGVAAGAVHGLPLGAESEKEAWSHYGGRWRLVRVRYPRIIPPAYGHNPLPVAAAGGFICAVVTLGLRDFVWAMAAVLFDVAGGIGGIVATARTDGLLPLAIFLVVAAILVPGIMLGFVTAALVATISAFADLTSYRTVRGVVLRRRSQEKVGTWLAIDDGHEERIRAVLFRKTPKGGIPSAGAEVEIEVSRFLQHVRSVRTVGDATSATTAALG